MQAELSPKTCLPISFRSLSISIRLAAPIAVAVLVAACSVFDSAPKDAAKAQSAVTASDLLDNLLTPYRFKSLQTPPSVKLKRLDHAKVAYEVRAYEYEFKGSTVIKQDSVFLEFSLGRLSKADFDKVKAAYPFAGNSLKHTPDRSYFLRDFLPDGARALINKRFVEKIDLSSELLESEKDALVAGLEANCWATAYEFGRGKTGTWTTWTNPGEVGNSVFKFFSSKPDLVRRVQSDEETAFQEAWGLAVAEGKFDINPPAPKDPDRIDNRDFFSTQILRLIQQGVLPRYPNPTLNKALQPGDLLMVPLDHAAVYIDENIYFERSALGARNEGGFRFVTFDDLRAKYDGIMLPGRFVHYRIVGELPKPSDVFSYNDDARLNAPGTTLMTTELVVEQDENGTPKLVRPD